MVEQSKNVLKYFTPDESIHIEIEDGVTYFWARRFGNRTLAEMPKEEAIELFTRALKLLQDEKDI